jgi:hydroxyethylthiazole kinase-like uncharacterized protein yjeF
MPRSARADADAAIVVVTPAVLRGMPLPEHGDETSKHDRGSVLVVGGSRETPGAVLLAGVAALRAGAGTLQLATAASAAPALAIAVPEARVVGLPEGGATGAVGGGDATDGVLAPLLEQAGAVLVGTGALDAERTADLLRLVAAHAATDAAVVVDAGALAAVAADPAVLAPLEGRAVLMPNPAEMAELLGRDIDDISGDPEPAVREAIEKVGTVVALRDAQTLTAAPGSQLFLDQSGTPALATSGSGDVLGGILAGFAARGADPLTAAVWAVHIHGVAGQHVTAAGRGLGILARELLDEIPRALCGVS